MNPIRIRDNLIQKCYKNIFYYYKKKAEVDSSFPIFFFFSINLFIERLLIQRYRYEWGLNLVPYKYESCAF